MIAISFYAAHGRYVASAAARHVPITRKYEFGIETHFDIFQLMETQSLQPEVIETR
jgi:hypothetical protein